MFSLNIKNTRRIINLKQVKTKTLTKNVLFTNLNLKELGCYYYNKHKNDDNDNLNINLNWKKLHRLNGPALIICTDVCICRWFFYGKLHRIDGPSAYNGNDELWFIRDIPHRLNGPAVIHTYGEPSRCWVIEGEIERIDGQASILLSENIIKWENGWEIPANLLLYTSLNMNLNI